MRPGRFNLVAGDFLMQVMARVLFSIAILTIATPAWATGERDDDRRLSAEILNPKMAVFYYYRATVHYYMDRYDDAITDYDLAIRLRRNYADAYYNRGLALDGKGQLRQALADIRKALTSNAFSIPASTWTAEARAKIIEIEMKLSTVGSLQAQTMAAGGDTTVVK
jgi:tetratricopeptide (TPR) repeat protein